MGVISDWYTLCLERDQTAPLASAPLMWKPISQTASARDHKGQRPTWRARSARRGRDGR